jgi:hypothetical protein
MAESYLQVYEELCGEGATAVSLAMRSSRYDPPAASPKLKSAGHPTSYSGDV